MHETLARRPKNRVPGPLELWAGVECTQNRVHDEYFEQLGRTGHEHRLDDLERIAALGVKAVRYPVLWERVEQGDGSLDWRWSDRRLAMLRDLGIRPIVGLVHHGSGPRHTNLIDPQFPVKLARFARRVAERYPWVQDFTPVNEPLTTARFSGLYGHWYPHGKTDVVFACALLNQARASVLAMRSIRDVIAEARLIHTEDLGQTFATSPLQYQADFENERRWLSLELLMGRVNEQHPLWGYLTQRGQVHPDALRFFSDHPCTPDIAGFNYGYRADQQSGDWQPIKPWY